MPLAAELATAYPVRVVNLPGFGLDAGSGRAARTFAIALRDPIEQKLAAIGVPALVTRGGFEPVVPQAWAERATRLLQRGELAVVPMEFLDRLARSILLD